MAESPSNQPLSTLPTRRTGNPGAVSLPEEPVAPPVVEPMPPLPVMAQAAVPALTASGPQLVAVAQSAEARRALPMRVIGRAVGLALALLALGVIAWVLADSLSANAIGPMLTFPDQGHDHIALGQPHPTYNSDPATSGWHREEFPPARILTTTVEPEVSIHAMEHGNVFVFYDCPAGGDCDTLRQQLIAVAQAEQQARGGDGATGVYLAPQKLPGGHKIALAAWMHLQYLDRFDQATILAFFHNCIGGCVAPTATPAPPTTTAP